MYMYRIVTVFLLIVTLSDLLILSEEQINYFISHVVHHVHIQKRSKFRIVIDFLMVEKQKKVNTK